MPKPLPPDSDNRGNSTANDATIRTDSHTNPRADAMLGCAATMGSVLVSCVLLFFNASFVMALLKLIEPLLPIWMLTPEATQFLLFLVPVLLLVIEWLVIDSLRGRIRGSSIE